MSPHPDPSSHRPRIEVLSGSPTEQELAASTMAIDRLLAEEAAAASSVAQTPGSRWLRAALIEGVAAHNASGGPWGVTSRADSG